MKRKIIQLGKATYVASLPSKWIREFHLTKGDYLEVEQKEHRLIISTKKETPTQEVVLDLRKINTRLIATFIQSFYLIGYDKIILTHEPTLIEYKTKKPIRTASFLQDLINKRFIGAEIVEQSDTRTVVMDLGGITEQTSEQVFNRVIFLIKTLTRDSFDAIKNKDEETLLGIKLRQDNISRFLMHFQRVVAKTRKEDSTRYALLAQLISQLKLVSGTYRHIAQLALEKKQDFTKKSLGLFLQVTESLDVALTLCLSYNQEKAVGLIERREKLWKQMSDEKNSFATNDLLLFAHFGELMFAMYSILKFTFTLGQIDTLLEKK